MTFMERLETRLRFGIYAPLRLGRHSSYYLSCSQFGEDMIVRHLLDKVKNGFYVDIGAHHPVYYSNTYHFYRRGWRGINVDALPGSMESFNVLRPRDINVEACVDEVAGMIKEFYRFDSPALNTASGKDADRAVRDGRGRVISRHAVRTVTLSDLLDKHLTIGQSIDFLSIDVEGMDEGILRTHDFDRYRPRVLMFERHALDPFCCREDRLITKLRGLGYELAALTGPTVIMHDSPEIAITIN